MRYKDKDIVLADVLYKRKVSRSSVIVKIQTTYTVGAKDRLKERLSGRDDKFVEIISINDIKKIGVSNQ